MHTIKRSNSSNVAFVKLVNKLDAELAERDGEDHAFYHQFNKIDKLNNVVVFYHNETAIACGALKKYDEELIEVKRMYTQPEHRGKGLASQILNELEVWARELGYAKCILETGIRQPEAIGLYKKNKYDVIENYGQYVGVENSVCFQKVL